MVERSRSGGTILDRCRSALVGAGLILATVPIHSQPAVSNSSQGVVSRLKGTSGVATTLVRTQWLAPAGPTVALGSLPPGDLILNGDFSAGLDDWTTFESGGGPQPGSVSAVSEAAEFLEGDSFLVTLQQSITVPAFASVLSFDLSLTPGFDLTSTFIPDAFEFSLLDDSLLPAVEPWTLGASSAFNVQEDGTVNLGSQVSWDGTTATVDVSVVPAGTVVTLYFDLIGGDLDTASAVQLDNVEFLVDPPVGTFVRGDLDSDGTVSATDADAALTLLLDGGALPLDCSGTDSTDVADGNDNEYLTIADHLNIRAVAGGSASLPAPGPFCGFDPSDDLGGFDAIDPNAILAAGDTTIVPPTGPDRDVFIPLVIDTSFPVTGLTIVFEFDDTILTAFDPLAGDDPTFESVSGVSATRLDGNRLMISVWAPNHGDVLVPAAPGTFQEIGALGFHIADDALVPPFQWLAEETVGSVTYRATVVDSTFVDHHPLRLNGGQFIRGDSNDDGALDIADPIYTLTYLFQSGSDPSCEDAADANDDAAIDIADPIYTLSYLFTSGPAPPDPFPACGFETTSGDPLTCQESSCQ